MKSSECFWKLRARIASFRLAADLALEQFEISLKFEILKAINRLKSNGTVLKKPKEV